MSCEHDWTISIDFDSGVPAIELRPISFSLTNSRRKYNVCRAKFPYEVGEEIKPHTKGSSKENRLNRKRMATVSINGNSVQKLLYRPDWITYGRDYTHIQFKDPHKIFSDEYVDIQKDTVNLKEIYSRVLNLNDKAIFDDYEFTLPDSQLTELIGRNAIGTLPGTSIDAVEESMKNTEQVTESNYAVDFQNITAEKAIQYLNQKFQIHTWFDRKGKMWIGLPEATKVRHLAAPNDKRVWRWKDPSLTTGREPIKTAGVIGSWVDEPGVDFDPRDWFDQGGTSEVRPIGIARRTDIEEGSMILVETVKAKKNALAGLAKMALIEEMKNQHAGSIEIDPDLSGDKVSKVEDLKPGDTLHLIPNDKYYNNIGPETGEIGDEPDNPKKVCGGIVNNEGYLVSEVEHNLTDEGDWTVHADLTLFPDVPIETSMTFFDPKSQEWTDAAQIDAKSPTDKILSGSWLSIEDL